MRAIIAAIGENFGGPLATMRAAIGPIITSGARCPEVPHLATALAMCDEVAELTRRYLDYLDQVDALPRPRPGPERPDEILSEIDRRLLPEAFGRGVAWSCAVEGPIRPMMTDRTLCLEALLEWAALAVESSRPGDCVSLAVAPVQPEDDRVRLTLASSAEEVIADLSSLREDPLFSRLVCLEEVGSDPGSRLALSLERMALLGAELRFEIPTGGPGPIRAIHFGFPASPDPMS